MFRSKILHGINFFKKILFGFQRTILETKIGSNTLAVGKKHYFDSELNP